MGLRVVEKSSGAESKRTKGFTEMGVAMKYLYYEYEEVDREYGGWKWVNRGSVVTDYSPPSLNTRNAERCNPVVTSCGGCDEPITDYTGHAGRWGGAEENVYCSDECRRNVRNAVRRARYAGEKEYSWSSEKPMKVKPQAKKCLRCEQSFTPKRSDAKYCTDTCRKAAHRSA